jgi:hypothetical protein
MWVSSKIYQRRARHRAQALSRAVHELPASTRRAMLAAAREQVLITGGYTNRHGDICPMLAAHRRGARTDVGQFPRAWDQFTEARRPRPATARELDILRALLEESLVEQHRFRPGSPVPAGPQVPADGVAPPPPAAGVAPPSLAEGLAPRSPAAESAPGSSTRLPSAPGSSTRLPVR